MIVKLVKYSVLKCLCRKENPQSIKHFSAPVAAAAKPLTCQPQASVKSLLTEIRYEEGKGGLRYEVILTEPAAKSKPCPAPSVAPRANICQEDIGKKLKAAEQRRREMLEAMRHADVTDKLQRASQKRHELHSHFAKQTKETLDQKMEEVNENRQAHIAALKRKLEEHRLRVETLRSDKQNRLSAAINPEEISSGLAASG